MGEELILVDEKDRKIGTGEKMEVHKTPGKLHRAFSIFIFNSRGKLLIQKRARTKYHSGGLWSNTWCSHPRDGESVKQAANRRLKEEFGFTCKLKEVFSFIYHVHFRNGFSEYEFDHVLVGKFDGNLAPNSEEIEDWKWVDWNKIKEDVKKNLEKYTPWFRIAVERLAGSITMKIVGGSKIREK